MNDGILKCKASNTIGSNTDQIRLNVQCKFEFQVYGAENMGNIY